MAHDAAKRYHRTLITVEVLTEAPLQYISLVDLQDQIVYDQVSVKTAVFAADTVDRKTMRKMLVAQGSDPNFFDHGDDHDDDDGLTAPIRWFRDA